VRIGDSRRPGSPGSSRTAINVCDRPRFFAQCHTTISMASYSATRVRAQENTPLYNDLGLDRLTVIDLTCGFYLYSKFDHRPLAQSSTLLHTLTTRCTRLYSTMERNPIVLSSKTMISSSESIHDFRTFTSI
jgi:hypothetical protein